MPDAIRSSRTSPHIERLYALVREGDGIEIESIVRRDTPYGTQPWITDDPVLARMMFHLAREQGFEGSASIVVFERVA